MARLPLGTGAKSLAWELGSALQLRAVIFDLRVLVRYSGERPPPSARPRQPLPEIRRPEDLLAQGRLAQMLTGEIRDELRSRGLSLIGDRTEIEARLQTALTQPTPQLAAAAPTRAPSNLTDGDEDLPLSELMARLGDDATVQQARVMTAGDLRGKYADKLRARGASELLKANSDHGAVGGGSGGIRLEEIGRIERERERAVRSHAHSELTKQADRSGYAFQHGSKDLLHYLDMRGMRRVLLPSDDASDAAVIDAQAAALAQALQVPPFALVLPAAAAAAVRRGETQPLQDVCTQLGMAPERAMLVSDDSATIACGRKTRLLSCYVAKRLPGRAERIPADFCVGEFEEVRAAVETSNGVTFRDGSTEVISAFVGGD